MFARQLGGPLLLALTLCLAPPALAQDADDQARIDELIGELQELIERGEQNREADPWFLEDMKALVRKYDWPWQTVLYDQSFLEVGSDNLPPGWTPLQGRYRMEPNFGYRTLVESQPGQQQRSNEELVGELVGSLLGQALNKNNNNSSQSTTRYTPARAVAERPVSNAFALSVLLSLRPVEGTQGRVGIGPYQGEPDGGGYRLFYLTGAQPGERSFELVRRSARGTVSTIEFSDADLGLEDGQDHEILWTRDRDGQMTVSVDGQQIMAVTDRSFADPFDGITFVNTGGDAAISHMKIEGAS